MVVMLKRAHELVKDTKSLGAAVSYLASGPALSAYVGQINRACALFGIAWPICFRNPAAHTRAFNTQIHTREIITTIVHTSLPRLARPPPHALATPPFDAIPPALSRFLALRSGILHRTLFLYVDIM